MCVGGGCVGCGHGGHCGRECAVGKACDDGLSGAERGSARYDAPCAVVGDGVAALELALWVEGGGAKLGGLEAETLCLEA